MFNLEIAALKKLNNNFLIRCPGFKKNKHIPNTYRFFEIPTVKSTIYVYCRYRHNVFRN